MSQSKSLVLEEQIRANDFTREA